MPRHLLHNATAKSPRATRASDKPDQILVCIWMWNGIWIWIWHTHTPRWEYSKLNSLPRITNGWKMRAEAENPFIIFRLSVCVCACVCVGVRAWVCACVTGESLQRHSIILIYMPEKLALTNVVRCPRESGKSATRHILLQTGLVMEPSRKVLRSTISSSSNEYNMIYFIIKEGFYNI